MSLAQTTGLWPCTEQLQQPSSRPQWNVVALEPYKKWPMKMSPKHNTNKCTGERLPVTSSFLNKHSGTCTLLVCDFGVSPVGYNLWSASCKVDTSSSNAFAGRSNATLFGFTAALSSPTPEPPPSVNLTPHMKLTVASWAGETQNQEVISTHRPFKTCLSVSVPACVCLLHLGKQLHFWVFIHQVSDGAIQVWLLGSSLGGRTLLGWGSGVISLCYHHEVCQSVLLLQ